VINVTNPLPRPVQSTIFQVCLLIRVVVFRKIIMRLNRVPQFSSGLCICCRRLSRLRPLLSAASAQPPPSTLSPLLFARFQIYGAVPPPVSRSWSDRRRSTISLVGVCLNVPCRVLTVCRSNRLLGRSVHN
jgi:hypothetical protein